MTYQIPDKTLQLLPVKLNFIEEIEINSKRILKVKFTDNDFYNASKIICVHNYRNTSKLLNNEE